MAAETIGPTCVAHIATKQNRTAKPVPDLSFRTSQRSLRIPTPTVKQGPENRPAKKRAKQKMGKVLETAQMSVKVKERGTESW